MKGEVSPDPDSLVAHREFVEALARRLVDDRHVAEDLAQETFLAALRRPPRAAAALRGFLARVLRKRRARWLRDEERRLRKERAAARPDRAEGGGDLVARLSWHRKVVDALLALEEPYRTTLLLRFYEDLKPSAIAERLGVPPGTVRARLSRGLERMRARLDADHKGDRRSWQLGLLPLLACARPNGALLGVAAMVGTKKTVAAAALVLALAGSAYVTTRTLLHPAPAERSEPQAAGPARAEVDRAPDPTTIAREDEQPLVVRVRNERDEPIAGAEVVVLGAVAEQGPGFVPPDLGMRRWIGISQPSRPAIAQGVTDASGSVALIGLTGQGWDVIARAAGYCSATRSLMWGRSDEVVTLRLGPSRTLSGRVSDMGGVPVPGAVVLAGDPSLAWNLGYGDPPLPAVADENGEFVLEALPARDLAIFAGFPGGIAFHVATLRFPGPSRFDITLERGGVLIGRVLDREGRGLPDAEIRVASSETNPKYLASARTDAAGRYVIDTLPPCTISRAVVEKRGYALEHAAAARVRSGIELRAGETSTLDLLMGPGASIRGLVTGPDGPVVGIRADAWTSRDIGIFCRKATTDAEGRFVLDSLGPGKYLVQAYPVDGSRPEGGYVQNPFKAMDETEDSPYVVVLREGEVRERAIRIVTGDRVVEGIVLGPDGKPFPGARVAAKGASTESTSDGSFRLERVFEDADSVVAFAAGYRQVLPKPAAAPSGVVIALETAPPEPRVVGTVRGPAGDLPQGACVLFATEEKYGGYGNVSEERLWYKATRYPISADGSFEFVLPTPQPGRFWLRARAPGFGDGAPVELAADEVKDVHEVALTLVIAHSLRGIVADVVSGEPVPHARVSVRRPRPPYWMVTEDPLGPGDAVAAVTDEAGSFHVDELSEGWWEVAANADGYVQAVAKAELPGGIARVSLAPTLSIAGIVTYPDGSPVPNVYVYALPAEPKGQRRATSRGTKTADDGTFETGGLEAGDYKVMVQTPFLGEPNIVGVEVAPVAAGTTDLRVVAERGLSITGIVVDSDNDPVRRVNVAAQPEGQGRVRSARSADDGTFTIFGLRDEPHTLRFTKDGDDAVNVTRPGVRAGARDLRVEVRPTMRGLSIVGILVDEAGMPLANRTVQALAGAAIEKHAGTDADGRFAIHDLEPGRKGLRLAPECGSPYLSDLGNAEAGETGLRLVPRRGMEIKGIVTVEGMPLPDALVSAQMGEDHALARTDASGVFTLGGIPEDAVCLVMCAGTEDLIRAAAKDVLAGATGVKLTLKQGLEVRGRVLDADGAPLTGVLVQLRRDDELGARFKHATTDDEGRFVVKGLAPGTHEVSVHLDYEYRPCGTIEAGATNAQVRVPR